MTEEICFIKNLNASVVEPFRTLILREIDGHNLRQSPLNLRLDQGAPADILYAFHV